MLQFKEYIENLFKTNDKYSDSDDKLYVSQILEDIEKIDKDLIRLLMSDTKAKKKFFMQVDEMYVLEQNKLIEFFTLNDYMKNNSYTSYTNKIGLIKKDNFIKKFDDVVLAFPHKDCILEGGQTKDDDKNKEVFYNEIISSDEIDRLFEPKVLTNIKRYSKDGVEENPIIKDDDNLILKGNNLIALHSLKLKYAGKVKLIYIDPPYNTGKDTFGYNDNFNHSTWLTFMKSRLEITKEFLCEKGVVFISCDDNEQAYLKILMDEIFHRDNYLGNIIWQTATDNNPTQIKTEHEYVICYAKNKSIQDNWSSFSMEQERLQDEYIKLKEIYNNDINKMQIELRKYIRHNKDLLDKVTHYDNIDDRGVYHDADIANTKKGGYKYDIIHPTTKKICKIPEYGFRFPQNTINEMIKNNDIVFGKNETILIKPKKRLLNVRDTLRTVIYEDGRKSTKELEDMFYRGVFKNPKSPTVLKRLFSFILDNNDICLDFFAGSGTTAQVVLEINQEQDKNIKFILIEQMDYVDNITKIRVKKIIEKNKQGNFVYAELKKIDDFKDTEIGALNKNMQYLPISDIEDEEYKISKEEIEINKKFYGIDYE